MKVRMAKKIGFCFGVKRAIEISESALSDNKEVRSLGSVIHNKQVVDRLSRKGLKVVKDIDAVTGGVIVVSSHGISPKIAEAIRRKGLKLIDTTCPFVLNAQRLAKSLSDGGYEVIIVGDKEHPEVKALIDFVAGTVSVVKDKDEVGDLRLKPNAKVSVISQTTQSVANFLSVVKAVVDTRPKELKVVNTICRDVEERQAGACTLAKEVDMMLVVGGRNSANTQRLFDLCGAISDKVYLVETEKDLKDAWFRSAGVVGITSGASTPDWIVKRVVDRVKVKSKREKVKAEGKSQKF